MEVLMLTCGLQRDMELLVLENLESAVKKGFLVTQVPEQESKVGSVRL
jgi:hypothetical protein